MVHPTIGVVALLFALFDGEWMDWEPRVCVCGMPVSITQGWGVTDYRLAATGGQGLSKVGNYSVSVSKIEIMYNTLSE